MVSVYAPALVDTLKWAVSPLLYEMSDANPWMLGSPDPEMSHWELGLPGFVFSQATAFVIGTSHGAASATVAIGDATGRTPRTIAMMSRKTGTAAPRSARHAALNERPAPRSFPAQDVVFRVTVIWLLPVVRSGHASPATVGHHRHAALP